MKSPLLLLLLLLPLIGQATNGIDPNKKEISATATSTPPLLMVYWMMKPGSMPSLPVTLFKIAPSPDNRPTPVRKYEYYTMIPVSTLER